MTFDELLNQFEPKLAEAFRESIEAIKSSIVLARVIERLERGDIAGAVAAMELDAEAFGSLEIALQEAFNAGGISMMSELPARGPDGARVIWRFGVRNLEAERILREMSSTMVTLITEDQRQAVRMALESGLARGLNPRATALDVIGRQSRITGRREGGIIGLTSRQIEFIERARQNLESGDPKLMRKYLELGTRDKRFDRTVLKAVREGKPVPADLLQKMVSRLRDENLRVRGENVARTETMMALGTARDLGIRQQIAAGKMEAQDVTKIWRSAGDSRVRHTHRVLNGKGVGMDEAFLSPSGAMLRYPGDPQAPINETSGCRCRLTYKVDYIDAVARRYRAEAA